MRFCCRIPVLTVALVALIAFSVASAHAAKLKFAYGALGLGQSLLWVPAEAGIFKEHGLDMEFIFIGNSAVAVQALIAGNAPIGALSGATAISSVLAGADLVLLLSPTKDPVQSYLVAQKNITDPSQLKGKRLGINRFGSASDSLLRLILRKVGISEKEVAIVQVGGSSVRMAALVSGSIDATALSYEEMMYGKKLGFNLLLDVSKIGIETLSNDLVTSRKFIRESRDTVTRVVKSIIQGMHFYARNRDFAMQVTARYRKIDDMEKVGWAYEQNSRAHQKKPYPSIKGIELALEELGRTHPAARNARPEQFIDTSFIKELDDKGWIDSLYKN
jgi:ABC-type nitrate/sulfonate/bicarbonate transport system substrate-binding protein